MTTDVPRDWVSPKMIATWMCVPIGKVRGWIDDGLLPAVNIEGTIRVRELALTEFLIEHSTI